MRHHREEWLKLPAIAAVRARANAQVHSILNRFALVAAALRMAIEAGLLPWSIDETDLGIAACMTRWLKSRNGPLDVTGEMLGAIEQIRIILAGICTAASSINASSTDSLITPARPTPPSGTRWVT